MITHKELLERLYYDKDTGVFTWVRPTNRRIRCGDIAGIKVNGYILIGINKIKYMAHRLAWLYVEGSFPDYDIDHINGVRDDNRIINLRCAERFENLQNLRISNKNTSGHAGVTFDKSRGKWKAHIRYKYKTLNLGRFNNIESARDAYIKAKSEIHTFQPTVRS